MGAKPRIGENPDLDDLRRLEEVIYEFNVQATGISDGRPFASFCGTRKDAVVRVGHVLTLSLCAASAISAFLSGALSYRSALLMKELTLTRAELFSDIENRQIGGIAQQARIRRSGCGGLAKRSRCKAAGGSYDV